MTREEMINALAEWHYADMVAADDFEAIAQMAKCYLRETYEDAPLLDIEAEYAMIAKGADQ